MRPALPVIVSIVALATACSESPPADAAGSAPRAVVVGLDGLDYDFIRNTSNLEFMPNLAQLTRHGQTKVLEFKPTKPILSPIIWTSMVTGASPTRHGILDFFSYDKGAALPISTADRRMPAIWNILSAKGIRCLSLGTFISYPAEKVRGVYISDDAFTRNLLDATSIYPEQKVGEIAGRIGTLMADNGTWQASLEPFADDELAANVGRVFAISRAKLELFLELLERDDYGFAMVYIEGTDEIGHYLSHLWPTPISDDQTALAESVASAVPTYFALVDRYLGRIHAFCQRHDAALIIVSDHGFRWQNNRPSTLPYESEHAASWHSERGVFLMHHGELTRDVARGASTIYDLFPTLIDIYGLRHAGYEMGRSLLGKPRGITEDYDATISVDLTSGGQSEDPELLKRLAALGYIRSGSNLNASRYHNNLGMTLDEEEDHPGAIREYRSAIDIAPSNPNPHYNLSMVYFKTKQWEEFVAEFLRSLELGLGNRELAVVKVAESLRAMDELGVLEEVLAADHGLESEALNPHYLVFARQYYDSEPAVSLEWLDRTRSAAPDCRILFLKATCRLRLDHRPEQALAPLRSAGCQRELEVLKR